jgi:C4-dicarboxylate-specific signal transduction histidine kinase
VLTSAQAARLGVLSGQLAHDQIDEFLGRIADGARRANMLIERIGTFVRPSPTVLQSISLNDVVHEAVALSEGLLRSAQVAMEAHYSPASPQVSGDPLQLSQVILNLIRNGIEANGMGAGRELAVTCSVDGGDGVITVRDRGPGFAPDAVDRLGTPFFTTKPDGMGMGLAIAQSIARQHGGSLCFANAVDGGAQVELRLPLKCTVDRQVARS